MDLHSVLSHFQLPSPVTTITPLAHGRINDTYRVECENGTVLGLQLINHRVFPRVDDLMHNLVAVSHHIQTHEHTLAPLIFLPTLTGEYYYFTHHHYYRVFVWITDTTTYETAPDLTLVKAVGQAVGEFQHSLISFPIAHLKPVLPDFHHTVKRLTDFKQAIAQGDRARLEECHAVICSLLHRESYACRVVDAIAAGEIPLRVTHNDTKLNNFLIDPHTHHVRALIDWDTITPGSVLYDVGDALRSLGNTASEDTLDLSQVQFDSHVFQAFMEGFLKVMGPYLSAQEKALLAFAPLLITYELTLRFLGDYCSGDTYFKIQHPHHNYERAMVQFTLLQSIESQLPQLEVIISDLLSAL